MNNRVFGERYKILEKIGSGGMANVYKGEDLVLNRIVAIKVLHEQFSGDESFVARFKQEAQSAANLTYPNIVNIFDWGKESDSYYIIMEYLKGQNLHDYIADAGHLTWQEACDIGLQVSNALGFAHKNDVIHRDIKPHNIIVTRDGAVKVTDFGIARAGGSTMTQTGAILGTAHYISPEQAKGETADARSDIYSLGIVMFEMLAGRTPFSGDNPVSIAMKHVQENVPSLKEINPNIPESVINLLNKILAKNPGERYQSALDLKQDFSAVMKGLPINAEITSEQQTVIIKPTNSKRATLVRPIRRVKKKRKIWPFFALLGVVFLVLVALALASSMIVKRIEVPDVRGLTLTQAKTKLKKKDLTLKISARAFSESVKKGLIIEQDPEEGFQIQEGKPVEVVVSKGTETTIVPNLYGKSRQKAEEVLAEEGLNVGNIQYKESSSVVADTVLTQSPKAGKEVSKDSDVDIVVSKEVEKISVPSVIGRSKKNAAVILSTKNLKASAVERFDDDVEKGLVIKQTPTAGTEVEKNSTVTIYVSKGPEVKEVSVPNVVGLSLADATNQIQSAGLDIISTGTGSVVVSQNPAASSTVNEGTTVTVTLGEATE